MCQMWKAPAFAAIVVLIWANAAAGSSYTGQLVFKPPVDASDGVSVSGQKWLGYTAAFSWTVSDTDTSHPGFEWKYSYEFKLTGGGKLQNAISHILIETPSSFSSTKDMAGLTGAILESSGLQSTGSDNPNMPGSVYGLRFAPTGTSYDMKWSFYSNRAPAWGDFYVKGGGTPANTAYDKGFAANDLDPASPLGNGSVQFNILRPGAPASAGDGSGMVPLPSSLWMGLTLLAVSVVIRQARRERT